jgi:hypothetical protein
MALMSAATWMGCWAAWGCLAGGGPPPPPPEPPSGGPLAQHSAFCRFDNIFCLEVVVVVEVVDIIVVCVVPVGWVMVWVLMAWVMLGRGVPVGSVSIGSPLKVVRVCKGNVGYKVSSLIGSSTAGTKIDSPSVVGSVGVTIWSSGLIGAVRICWSTVVRLFVLLLLHQRILGFLLHCSDLTRVIHP